MDGLNPSSDFETGIVNYLRLLTAQVRELKSDQSHIKLREEYSYRNHAFNEQFDDLELNVAKSEQYTRRDTITIVGLEKPQVLEHSGGSV